jgi:hypothetical protein
MSESLQAALSAAVIRLLRPLVRVLLRHGMAYGTFAELARKAFVDEGFEQVAASGKRPTVSSVSALTGLTRKETKRLREMASAGDEVSARRYSRAIRVISGWISDPQFQTGAGVPAVLPLEGRECSFAALVKKYSGDIPTAAMLSVLESSGTVEVENHRVTLHARAYLPSATPAEKLDILGTDVAELISTIDHNLEAPPGERYFQRKVSNVRVHPEALEAFRALSDRKSQELLEEYHRWLTSHEIDSDKDGEQRYYVAVGTYYTQYENTGGTPQ